MLKVLNPGTVSVRVFEGRLLAVCVCDARLELSAVSVKVDWNSQQSVWW